MDFAGDDASDLTQMPDGRLNVPYILSNANLLLKAGEPKPAISLFKLVTSDQRLGHCGYYGIALCLEQVGHADLATRAFAKAYNLQKRPYIATAWARNLINRGEGVVAERLILEFVRTYGQNSAVAETLKSLYEAALKLPRAPAPIPTAPPGQA